MKSKKVLKHHGVIGMHWGKRMARGIKDWAGGKQVRVGQGKMSNLEFDKQIAKEQGITLKEHRAQNKKYGAQRAAVFKKMGDGANKAKSALAKIGNNMYSAYPPQHRKKAAIIDIALSSVIVGGLVLASKKGLL